MNQVLQLGKDRGPWRESTSTQPGTLPCCPDPGGSSVWRQVQGSAGLSGGGELSRWGGHSQGTPILHEHAAGWPGLARSYLQPAGLGPGDPQPELSPSRTLSEIWDGVHIRTMAAWRWPQSQGLGGQERPEVKGGREEVTIASLYRIAFEFLIRSQRRSQSDWSI